MATLTSAIPNFFNALDRKIEPGLKSHLKNVYGCMSMALLATTIGSYVHLYTGLLSGGILSSLLSLGLLMALVSTPHDIKNHNLRMGYLLGLAFSSGLSLGPLLELALFINPATIVTALISTSVIFACFTLATMFSNQRKWLYLGGLLSSALSLLLTISLVNLFIGSKILFQFNLYVGLMVMCGFIVFDTSLIMEKFRLGDEDFIWHSVLLFIDFLDVFKHILVILMQREERQSRKKK